MKGGEREIKMIIEEFNRKLSSWGHSDTWTNNQFNVLEALIYEKSRIRIHANTLKRFFCESTSNPQFSTRNALCIFLGYEGYNDFVMKNMEAESQRHSDVEKPVSEEPESAAVEGGSTTGGDDTDGSENESVAEDDSNSGHVAESSGSPVSSAGKHPRRLTPYIIGVVVFAVLCAVAYLVFSRMTPVSEERLMAESDLQLSVNKGVSPLTVKVNYDIPERAADDVTLQFVESNGDVINHNLSGAKGSRNATFVYPGMGHVRLMHGDKVLKEKLVESRRSGWQIFVSEGRTNYFKEVEVDSVYPGGYITIPESEVPGEAQTDKLFVSYIYYAPDLVDGDNFTVEAKVRNYIGEGGIPCYDTMLYVFAGDNKHGFALNEDAFSYFKFMSGEKSYTGDKHDFSDIKYNPRAWHILRISVRNRHSRFYLDDRIVFETDYDQPLGKVDELTLRFKGRGAVDYIKLYDGKGREVFQEDF